MIDEHVCELNCGPAPRACNHPGCGRGRGRARNGYWSVQEEIVYLRLALEEVIQQREQERVIQSMRQQGQEESRAWAKLSKPKQECFPGQIAALQRECSELQVALAVTLQERDDWQKKYLGERQSWEHANAERDVL